MSLRVWLPLTKDLRNQGLSDTTVSIMRGNETWDNNGKLGKCFYANGVNTLQINNIIPQLYNASGYSLCAWFYIESQNTVHSGAGIVSGGNWNNQVLNLSVSDWSSDHYTRLRVSGTNWNNNYIYNFYKNTWYHAVVCSDGNKTYAYVNGQLIGDTIAGFLPSSVEGNNIAIGGATYYSGMQFFGKINDVRIYDHCLSPMEVKELAKGFVLHYPLNRQGFGQENLASQYIMPGGNKPGTTATDGRTNYYGDYGISIPATENADTYFSIWYSEPLESGATYTLSAEVSGLLSGSYYSFHLFAQDNTSMGIIKFNHNGLNTFTFTMNYTGTITTTTYNGKTYYRMFMDDVGRVIASGQGTITIKNIKLEKGSTATPWCPNSSDALATTLGLNSVTEYDCSGYCNNGTKTGTFDWIGNSPRYSVSTKFNTNYIERNNVVNNPSTTAFWIKFDSLSNQIVFTDYNTVASLGIYNNNLLIGYGADCKLTYPKTIITTDKWYHVCIVKSSNATAEFYLDGILQTPGSTTDYWTRVGTNSQIGARSTNYYFKGNLSDFRIYATALSADDVKSLYQNSAYIDSSGNVYGTIHES